MRTKSLRLTLIGIVSLLLGAVTIHAATFTVTNTNDTGAGSLRQAVIDSNNAAGSDEIVFDSSFDTPKTIVLASTITIAPAVGDTLTINGPGATLLTISGDDTVRIFNNADGGSLGRTASISGISFTHAVTGAINTTYGVLTVTDSVFDSNTNNYSGALIGGNYSLTVTNCTFSNNINTAPVVNGVGGAAISATGTTGPTVMIDHSTFTNNSATNGGAGGAIFTTGGNVMITDSTFTGNTTTSTGQDSHGGAIAVCCDGHVTVINSTLTGNQTTKDGGAIYFQPNSGGTPFLVLQNTTIANNTSNTDNSGGGAGGGIFLTGTGSATISGCTFSENTAMATDGGGIYSTVPLTMTNSTLSDNTAGGNGGGLHSDGISTAFATLESCTIAGNTASTNGGGINSLNNPVVLHNTIVADNMAANGPDLSGNYDSQGYNLIEDPTDATITGETETNITGEDPHLGPLSDNGGPTQTEALLAGSPALDAAEADDFPAKDQRGFDRPRDGDGNGSLLPDIGAYERAPGSLQFSSAEYSVDENVEGGKITITVTRLDGSDTAVSVDYATSDGTAVAGDDYQPASGTLEFPAGVTSESFEVQIIDDSIPESDETINLTLSNPSEGGTLGMPATATITILDNDTTTGSLLLTGAASRKIHGDSGAFDLPLILGPAGDGTVEPRTGGPTQLIFTFSDNVVAADGMIDANEFAILNATFESASITANQITLNLTNVIDQSVVSVALGGIESTGGAALSGDSDVEIRALLGDANQDRTVERGDLQTVKPHVSETADDSNFVFDLDLNGTINAGDGRIIRQNKFHSVP